MKQRLLAFALAAGCVILLLVCYVLRMKRDVEPPVITIEETDLTYTEGEDESKLLEGVTAKDNKDGDVTDQVFVDKILSIDEETAIVYYGVLDKSNNVGTARRTVKYKKNSDSSDETTEDSITSEEMGEETTEEDSQEEYGVPQAEGSPDIQPDGGRPAIALVAESVKIKAGDDFEPLTVVWGVVDDKDGTDVLYQHIHVEGEYHADVPGTYEIQYYVSDSDGNTSDPHDFTLTVE